MPRAKRTCSRCPAVIDRGTLCSACTAAARSRSDRQRRPEGNPYATTGHRAFRRAVLARDPVCVLCRAAWATIADHYPLSRRELATAGLDVDDPQHGRGLCKPCHDRETALHQPGGWAANRRLTTGAPEGGG